MAARRPPVLDLNRLVDKAVTVKMYGGRQVAGTLKGFDQLMNMVLDEAVETLRDPHDIHRLTADTRALGLVVCRGTSVMTIFASDGTVEIENPFAADAEKPAI